MLTGIGTSTRYETRASICWPFLYLVSKRPELLKTGVLGKTLPIPMKCIVASLDNGGGRRWPKQRNSFCAGVANGAVQNAEFASIQKICSNLLPGFVVSFMHVWALIPEIYQRLCNVPRVTANDC